MIVKNNDVNNYTVNLLCSSCKTCPEINIRQNEDKVIITDDYNNVNIWTMENFREFVNQSKNGAFDQFL